MIVATPGRLIDLMERGVARLGEVENVVLDEADEMLNMGFTESIDAILSGVPAERNTLLFSATMSSDIERIAKNYLHDYKEIVVGSRNEGAENVNHVYYLVHAKDKYLALKRVVDYYPRIYGIIFCRTARRHRKWLNTSLTTATVPSRCTATSRRHSVMPPCRNSASIKRSCSWPPMWRPRA